ncbi:MAG: peptidyl-prolyl cis-trans isomerase [Myxococcales bacterium]
MSRLSRVLCALLLAVAAAGSLHSSASSQALPPAAQPAVERTPEDIARRKQAIVKADGEEVTVGELEDFLNSQPPMMRERYRNPDEQKKLIESMLRVDLLATEAARKGYDKNPTVVRTVKDSSVQALLRAEIDAKYSPQTVSAEAVKAYYDEHSAEFHRPAMRRASMIVLGTEAEAKQLLAEAQKADVRKFAELAKQHSTDNESKLRAGDLGYFGKDEGVGANEHVPKAVRAATFTLKTTGDVSPKPVQLDAGGFAIVRLTGERPERNTELSEADLTIRTKLWREQRQQALTSLVDGLRTKEKPQVFAERADWIKFDDMDKRPAGFSPDRPGPAAPGAGHPVDPHAAPGAAP